MVDPRITSFLEGISEIDGEPSLSDAKSRKLISQDHFMLIEENDEIIALGVVARHIHDDSTHHWAVENVLSPGLRFPEFEDFLLASSLELVPVGEPLSVWSHRSSLDAALERASFSLNREVLRYVVDLPLSPQSSQSGDNFTPPPTPDSPPLVKIRSVEERDIPELLRINRDAFAGHREASALDESELVSLREEKHFRDGGHLVALENRRNRSVGTRDVETESFITEDSDRDDMLKVIGFCLTRVHDNGDGEIYRIAVEGESEGRGVGRALLHAGFDYLSDVPEVHRGTLWVESTNITALPLYESVGMVVNGRNREFERANP